MKNLTKTTLFLLFLILVPRFVLSLNQYDRENKVVLKDGDKCPNFEYYDTDGKKVTLKDFKGYYVYIDFWATW